MGLFNADQSLANQVQVGSLMPFEVHTHDGGFSPKTGRINIDPTKSYAFDAVVIGNIYPSNEKRANISFLWILNDQDTRAFLNDSKKQIWSDGTGKKIYKPFNYKENIKDSNGNWLFNVPEGLDKNSTGDPEYGLAEKTFGEFLKRINQDPAFKDTELTKKLNSLLGYQPDTLM